MRAPAVSFAKCFTAVLMAGLLTFALLPATAFAEGEGEPFGTEGSEGAFGSEVPTSPQPPSDPSTEVDGSTSAGSSAEDGTLAASLMGRPAGFVNADVALDGEPVVGSFTVNGLTFAVVDELTVELVGVSRSEASGSTPAALEAEADGSVLMLPESIAYEGVDYAVSSIGAYAFYLSGVTSVELPMSVTDVDDRAFRSSDVASAEVAGNNPNYSSFDGALYDAEQLSLLLIPEGKQGTVLLPKEAESAAPSVFSHCPLVTQIAVEEGSAAFASENGLLYDASLTTLLRVPAGATEIAIHDGCTTIAAGAMEACASLAAINAPASVTSISPDVFTAIPTVSLLAAALTGASDPGSEGEPSSQDAAPQLTAMVALSSIDDGLPVPDLGSTSVVLGEGSDSSLWDGVGFLNVRVWEEKAPTRPSDDVVEVQSALSTFSGSSYAFVLYDAEGSGTTSFCWILQQPGGTFVDAGGNSFRNPIKGLWPIGRQEGKFFYTTPVNGSGRLFIATNIDAEKKSWYDVAFAKNEYTGVYIYPGETWSHAEAPYIAVYLTQGQARKITWDGNGGSVAPGSCPAAMIGANSSTAYTWCGNGRTTLAPNATRSGCRFVGWTTQKNGTGTIYESADRIPAVYGDTTYYAQWRCDVSWDANGGSVASTSSVVVSGGAVTTPVPTRTGYTCTGWATSRQGTPVCQAGHSISVTSHTTYYAQWSPNPYTVEYWNKAGTTKLSSDANFKYDTSRTLAARPSSGVSAGYTAVGWATSANQSTATYGFSTSQKNLATSGTKKLYLAETANRYTISFNANWGSGGQTAQVDATYGSAMPGITSTKPTRQGYSFLGWYDTRASSGGTQYYTADGRSARNWNKTSAATLYARWSPVKGTVAYKPGAGATTTSDTYYRTWPAGGGALSNKLEGNEAFLGDRSLSAFYVWPDSGGDGFVQIWYEEWIDATNRCVRYVDYHPAKPGYRVSGWKFNGQLRAGGDGMFVDGVGSITVEPVWEPIISADVPHDVTARVDLLGIEEQQDASAYIESRCGEPLTVSEIALTPLEGAREMFSEYYLGEGGVRFEALVGQGASWEEGPTFWFSLDEPQTLEPNDPSAPDFAFRMASYGSRVPIAYRFDIPDELLPDLVETTKPVCSVAYTVALASK